MFSYNEYRKRIDQCFRNRHFTISTPEEERLSILKELQCSERTIELYQYRRCNELSFYDLLENQITLVHPKYFNDCFEGKPFYNFKKFSNKFNSFDLNATRKLLGIAKERDFTQKEIREIGGNNIALFIKKLLQKLIEENAEETFYAKFDLLQHNGLLQADHIFRILCNSKRDATRIACFSEKYDSPFMWGLYADASKGFCVKHTLPVLLNMSLCPNDNNGRCDKSDSCDKVKCIKSGNNWLFPVIYCKKRPDFTDELTVQLAQTQFQFMNFETDWSNYDFLTELKLICYKSLDWKHEREWRWIHTLCSNDIPDFSPISVGTISGLYLGEQISQEHEAILKEYASKHKLPDGSNIPIYKMTTDLCNPQYKLTAKRIL